MQNVCFTFFDMSFFCRCPDGYYLNRTGMNCIPLRESCGYGYYFSSPASPIADRQCSQCRKCPAGKFRTRAHECDGSRDYDPLLLYGEDGACQPCRGCWPSTYMNKDMCDGWGTVDIDPANIGHCIPCKSCPDMHIIKNQCPGGTAGTVDTQTCEPCISYCSDNTYVNDAVCDGYHFADVGIIDPMDCATCPRRCDANKFEIRVSGCTGKDRTFDIECRQCGNLCEVGQYVTDICKPDEPAATCASCVFQCPKGSYFSSPCTGQRFGVQDVSCVQCAPCPSGQYISYQCPGGNVIASDTRQCSNCTSQCPPGFFLNGTCRSGRTTYDAVQCMRCSSSCPVGQYMHAPCNGTTAFANSNDCRPCAPCSQGQYMSAGLCMNGTATSSMERTCSACRQVFFKKCNIFCTLFFERQLFYSATWFFKVTCV